MNPLDRLLSLVRQGDTINLQITGTEAGSQIVIAARLKGRSYNPEDTSAENALVAALTYPHLIEVAPDQTVSTALDLALDSLAGAQAEGLSRLSEIDQAASRIREAAAAAGKAKSASGKAAGKGTKPAGTVVTATDGSDDADDAETGSDAAPPTHEASAAPADDLMPAAGSLTTTLFGG